MTNPAKLNEKVHVHTQGGRAYFQCKVCGKDFVSYQQGIDYSGWLGLKINQKYKDHVRMRHPELKDPSSRT
jgi:hypothetical protein